METSIAKQNFSIESENGLNQQIQIDQIAQQQYLSTAAYFDRDDVALPGLVKHFLEEAEHEGERVQTFIDYQQMRGGVAIVKEVPQPSVRMKLIFFLFFYLIQFHEFSYFTIK
ncbi:hypothetical protein INT45_014238 [Circinella minor]|uniref:Ferritin n=1 Tax=Circinella minor TaxID=1195481 RepID=A0A8H7VTH1_9FUNG|nr:hypothetical protein INT45_014238 [Circinella minor]